MSADLSPPTMIWHRPSSARWISACSRYSVEKSRVAGGEIQLSVYFYGYLAMHTRHETVGDELPGDIRRWCESHRQRVLPQIIEFELWISTRYRVDVNGTFCGPYMRRDRVFELIRHRGELRLPLRNAANGITLTLAEIFAELYQSICPARHESGDGV